MGRHYVLKGLPKEDIEYRQRMYDDLRSCPYVRVAEDYIPEQSMFAYNYFKDQYLSYAQNDIPLAQTKRILKDCLSGIAAMHQKGIVHTDVKPNNIIIDWQQSNNGKQVLKVQIGDIEDAVYLKPNQWIIGSKIGNWMWRSPEAHAKARVNTPSDIFSFGIVVCLGVLTIQIETDYS